MKEGQNIKVVARLRPLNQLEMNQGGECCVAYNEKSITVTLGATEKNDFTFDRIFGPDSEQADVYLEVARPILESVINGYNGTIFAYGQTSSGKTFTMEGPDNPNERSMGLIPRVMADLFEIINSDDELVYIIKVSFLEIYNEKIQDLLDANNTNLKIKEDRLRGIFVHNLTEVVVQSAEEMKKVMTTGSNNRTIAATRMNERSSRSHSIFQIFVSVKNIKTDSSKISKLYFVDLAGSEKITKTNVTGQQLEEAKNINKSLTCLGMVINALTSDKKEHIPYRDSKLTRILSESLGGNAKTTLVVACSMCSYNNRETQGTLRFGARAKAIKNKPLINAERSARELQVLLDIAEKKIQDQEEIIKELMDKVENDPQSNTLYHSANNNNNNTISNKASVSSLQMLKQHKLVVNLQEELEVVKTEYAATQINLQNRIEEIQEKYMKEKLNSEKLKSQIQDCLKINQKYILENEHLKTHILENDQQLQEFKRIIQMTKQDLNFFMANVNMKQQYISDTESTKDIFMMEQYDKDIEERTFQSILKLQETLANMDKQIGSETLIDDDQQSLKIYGNQKKKNVSFKMDSEPSSPKLTKLLESENFSFQTDDEDFQLTIRSDDNDFSKYKQDLEEESDVERLLALISDKMEDNQNLMQIQDVIQRLRKQVQLEQQKAENSYQRMITIKDQHEMFLLKERQKIQQLKNVYQNKKKQLEFMNNDLQKQLGDLVSEYQKYQHDSQKQEQMLQQTNQQLMFALETHKSEFQLECTVKQLVAERNELNTSLIQTRNQLEQLMKFKNHQAEQIIQLQKQIESQELGKYYIEPLEHNKPANKDLQKKQTTRLKDGISTQLLKMMMQGKLQDQGQVEQLLQAQKQLKMDSSPVDKPQTQTSLNKYLRQMQSNKEMKRSMMISVQSLVPGQSFQKNLDLAKEKIKRHSTFRTQTLDSKMMNIMNVQQMDVNNQESEDFQNQSLNDSNIKE